MFGSLWTGAYSNHSKMHIKGGPFGDQWRPSRIEVMQLAAEAWDDVSTETILKFWAATALPQPGVRHMIEKLGGEIDLVQPSVPTASSFVEVNPEEEDDDLLIDAVSRVDISEPAPPPPPPSMKKPPKMDGRIASFLAAKGIQGAALQTLEKEGFLNPNPNPNQKSSQLGENDCK